MLLRLTADAPAAHGAWSVLARTLLARNALPNDCGEGGEGGGRLAWASEQVEEFAVGAGQ